jgi:hypothetical protein
LPMSSAATRSMIFSLSCVVVSTSASSRNRGWPLIAGAKGQKWRNLILVLEATLNGPRNCSRRPA